MSRSYLPPTSAPFLFDRSGPLITLEQGLAAMGVKAMYFTRPEHAIEVKPGHYCLAKCDLHVIPETEESCEVCLSSRNTWCGEEYFYYSYVRPRRQP